MMSKRTTVVAAAFAAWAVLSATPVRAQDVELPEQTVRYLGVEKGVSHGGRQAISILYVEPMKGGRREQVLLGTTQRMIDYFLKLAPGQPITVGLIRRGGKLYLTSVSAMPPKPGEKDRDTAYLKGVEVRKIKDKPITVLIVTKFDRTTLVEVPKVRTKDGQETSPALLAAIKAIKPGTLVEVQADAPSRYSRTKMPVLVSITPWAPWRKGTFAKLGRKTIDKAKYVTVEIKSAGIPLVLLVPKVMRHGRESDDRTMLRLLYKLKKGQAVEFKIRQQGLNQFLRKVRPSTRQ